MKTKLVLIVMFALAMAFLLTAQTSKPADQNSSSGGNHAGAQTNHAWRLPAGFSADQAYKSNCTRCHAEVPKMDTRRTKTIVQHMRVRANLTQDEAEAILEYMNK